MLVGAGVWWVLFRDDAPPEADIDDAAQTLEDEASTETTSPGAELSGTWEIDPSIGSFTDFSSSYVGYRVREELGGIGANTAVGRTPDVTGSVVMDGTTVTDASFEADLTTLQSDELFRDDQMRSQGLETDRFPTASFTRTEPADLGGVPANGETMTVEVTGELTLHGATQEVQVPLELVHNGDVVVVTGRLDVTMADYGIDPPTSIRVLSVEDHGVFELQLFLRRA